LVGGNLKRRDHVGNLGVDGAIILKRILKILGVDWIHLPQDKVQ
jgi:hypothetical protein